MKRIIFIVVALIILAAIPATVYLARTRQELRQKAAPATTLSFSPQTSTKKVDDTFSLEIRIDTAENQVVAAELHVTFDPEKLEAQSITNGQLFPQILGSGQVERGAASITVGAASATTPVTGTGTAAVVRFKALSATTSPVSVRFAPTTFVGALGENATNVLVGSTPATITIQAGTTIAPTPTATPSAGLSPTLTPAPLATGSTQASASAVTITAPAQPNQTTSANPAISGKANPGAVVTLTIYSTPVTVTVTADANGNWTYVPTTPLEEGPHNVVASALDPATGQTQTATTSFVVASGGEGGGSTDSAIPIAGSFDITLLMLALGMLLLGGGAVLSVREKRLWDF